MARFGIPYRGSNSNKQVKTERLFIQERFADEYRERMASPALSG